MTRFAAIPSLVSDITWHELHLHCHMVNGGVVARCAHGAHTVRARFNVFGICTQLLPR